MDVRTCLFPNTYAFSEDARKELSGGVYVSLEVGILTA